MIFLGFINIFASIKVLPFTIITFLSIAISSILDILNYIIFRKENIEVQKKFTKRIDGLTASIYRGLISAITLPNKSYISLKAICKTIYRMNITKEHLLEWTTSEEAEKKNKKDIKSMYMGMKSNVIFGIIAIAFVYFIKVDAISKIIIGCLGLIWILTPLVMWHISKPKEDKKTLEKLNKQEIDYVKKIAESTWRYFLDFMNKENNYLPPDNFQESRREKIVHRTSSTNIGLGLMTVISAYDLKFIPLEKALSSLENMMETIQSLEKWNGHLYNWYNTLNLQPLIPRYISTVDSGNFVRIYVYT